MPQDNDTEGQLKKLQMFEQNMQNFLAQKQQLQSQQVELNSALKELGDSDSESYKIIGNIMVRKRSGELKKDIEEKKEIIDLKLKSLEKQEKLVKDKSKKIQDEVMTSMNKEG